MILNSPLLREFLHGFSTRSGGVSEGPFHALNLGLSLGDRPSAVMENRRRFAEAARYDANALVEAHQVHGAAVRVIDPGEDPAASSQKPADALIGRDGV
ncbi:MAG: laccase domain-containing protein, partial [Myxococcota bacterium]